MKMIKNKKKLQSIHQSQIDAIQMQINLLQNQLNLLTLEVGKVNEQDENKHISVERDEKVDFLEGDTVTICGGTRGYPGQVVTVDKVMRCSVRVIDDSGESFIKRKSCVGKH
jgi:hypothetical protein